MTPEQLAPCLHRVCSSDTDSGGIVHHARYLEIAERSRGVALHQANLQLSTVCETYGVELVVKQARAMFFAPAVLDDVMEATSGILQLDSARSWWRTKIRRDGQRICDVDVQIVSIEPTTKTACLLPGQLIETLKVIPVIPLMMTGMRKVSLRSLEKWPD
jgi:acyl-CoA thioester hydrolase